MMSFPPENTGPIRDFSGLAVEIVRLLRLLRESSLQFKTKFILVGGGWKALKSLWSGEEIELDISVKQVGD